jgi:hypothetical protein
MSRRPRPCRHLPGDHGDQARCPTLTRHHSGLCEQHLRAERARVDEQRPTAARRGYGTAHRAARARELRGGRVCAKPDCEETRSLHRDHIDGDPHNNHPSNIQYLCASHHSRKTLDKDVSRDARGRIERKREARATRTRVRSIGT